MILNLSQIKTEALLLFCRDLIKSYQNSSTQFETNNKELDLYMQDLSAEMLTQIEAVTLKDDEYLSHRKHYRIAAILKAYNFLNQQITEALKEDSLFNPSMLYFSMLATWFKELGHESRSKGYIYFLLYPYAKVYDKLLVEIKEDSFKKLNIRMIDIAEQVVFKLERLSLK